MNSLVSILQEPWVLQAFGLSIYQSLDEDLVRAQYPFIIFIVLHTPRSSSDLPKLSGTWTYYLEQRLQGLFNWLLGKRGAKPGGTQTLP